jgi:hypothetical protein
MVAVAMRGAPQCPAADDRPMPKPRDVDDALDLAIDRTIRAQDDFESTPATDEHAVPAADKVVHRAEDVRSLADEADKPEAP